MAVTQTIEKDARAVAPEQYSVLFENDRVRVLELCAAPGVEIPMHSHPETVAFAFEDTRNEWTLPDGSRQDMDIKAGQIMYSKPFAHSAKNTGNTDVHLLIVEIKK